MKRSARFFLAFILSFFLSVSIFAQTISSRVSQNSDDAEEVVLTGNTDISSTDLELTQSGLTDQIVGLRFQDIQVPVGAHILSAYIEFETDELTNIDPCDITLYGQATDNPGTFTSTGGDISSRPHTTASVLWSPDAWNTVDEKHQTSDISTIIQEIVNRSGWSPGNSMVFTLEGTGQRVAESYEGEADAAALLVINYTLITNDPPDTPVLVTPADDATSIPDSPTLEVTVSDPESDLMNVTFYGRPVDETPPAEDFTIVGLPDTQYYSDDSPDTYFIGQTSWIVANKDILNIAFVAHEGDIVHNSASTDQYINADAAMSVLENPVTTGLPDGIPYGIIPGNHDLPTTNYNTYFGISRFSGRSYYGGYYGSNNDNNYSLFTAGGIDFIVLNLEFQPGTAVLDWADALLKANTDRQGIVVTHSILNANNSWSYEYVYSELQDNPNLFLMLCGHMHTTTDGAAIRIETGSGGNTIYILMADYQDFSNGGNGYLRTMRFSPASNKIYVKTYSPALDAYLTDSENQFELDYDMDASPDFEEIGNSPGISSGTNASVTWPGLDFETEYEWYAEVSDGTASTSSSIWSFTTAEASSLEVTSPNGTENWTAGTSHPITWTSDNTSGNVKIEYSTDNGSSWKEIIDIFADEGSYDWLVPDDPSTTCLLQISDIDNEPSDISDATFTITGVNDAPLVSDIPDQSVAEGTSFAPIILDDFVEDEETPDIDISWTYAGNIELTIDITDRIATITPPDENWNGSETIAFTATDDDGTPLSDSDDASFTVTAVNDAPVVSDIPDQEVAEGNAFVAIHLDDYVDDPETDDVDISWTYAGNTDLVIVITDRIATITPPDENWNGSETITFTATDDDGTPLTDSDDASFTVTAVNDPPVISEIDDQSVAEGSSFTTIVLDNYVQDNETVDENITWTVIGEVNLNISILDRIATIIPENENWNGSETIIFIATDDDAFPLSDVEEVTFTVTAVNDAPTVSDIPDQIISEGYTFATIVLDDYVDDPETADPDIAWTVSGATDLTITITDRIATIEAPNLSWIGSETITFTATDNDASPLSGSDDATFSVTVNTVDQSIALREGWNIFSLYVTTDKLALIEIVQPLIDEGSLLKIQNDGGLSIEPNPIGGGWLNYIGDWSSTEGYKIRVNTATSLDVNGVQIELPLTIDLRSGWNIMSYPVSAPQNALSTLSDLIAADNLLKVQNDAGLSIEPNPIGGGWLDYIVDFEPGEGYKIRVDLEDDLTISSAGKSYSEKEYTTGISKASHYSTCWQGNGMDHMNIFLELNIPDLEVGDEIGIFDGDLCVGAGKIHNLDLDFLAMVASADDPVTDYKDGFAQGNPIQLKVWNTSSSTEYILSDLDFRFGTRNSYEPMGSAFINVKSSVTDLKHIHAPITSLGNNYPNPFSQSTTLPFIIGKETDVLIEVYDMVGQRINILEKSTYKPGSYTVEWKATNNSQVQVRPGIYFVKMVANNQIFIKPIEVIGN